MWQHLQPQGFLTYRVYVDHCSKRPSQFQPMNRYAIVTVYQEQTRPPTHLQSQVIGVVVLYVLADP